MTTTFNVFHPSFIESLRRELTKEAGKSIYDQTELEIINNLTTPLQALNVNLELTETPLLALADDVASYQQLLLALEEVLKTKSLSSPFLSAWGKAISSIKNYVARVFPCLSDAANKSPEPQFEQARSLLPVCLVSPLTERSKLLAGAAASSACASAPNTETEVPFFNAYTRQRIENLLHAAIENISVTMRQHAVNSQSHVKSGLQDLVGIKSPKEFEAKIIISLRIIKDQYERATRNPKRAKNEASFISALQQAHEALLFAAAETCPAFREHHTQFAAALIAAQRGVIAARCCTAWTVIGCLTASLASGCLAPLFSMCCDSGERLDKFAETTEKDRFGFFTSLTARVRNHRSAGYEEDRCEGVFTTCGNRAKEASLLSANFNEVVTDSYMLLR